MLGMPTGSRIVNGGVRMLGRRLRDYREARGVSQTHLAAHLGRSKQWLCEIEHGRTRLSYEMAVRIARFFGTTPDRIFLDQPDLPKAVNQGD